MGWTPEAENAWLAGIIDGEGSVVMGFTTGNTGNDQVVTRIVVASTEQSILQKTMSILARIDCKYTFNKWRNKRHGSKECFYIAVTAYRDILKLIDEVLPYMVSYKAKRAELMKEFIELRLTHCSTGPNDKRGYTEEEMGIARNIRYLKAI